LKRVCIVGNSHALAWMQAWTETPADERAGSDLTFFASLAAHLEGLTVVNGQLCSADDQGREALERFSDGRNAIDPKEYDAFVVVGSKLDFRLLTAGCERFGTLDRQSMHKTTYLISEACLSDLVCDIYGRSHLALRLAITLRELSGKPVILTPTPCLTPDFLLKKESYGKTDRKAYFTWLYSIFLGRLQSLTQDAGLLFLPQDPLTLAGPGFTKRRYAIHGQRMKERTSTRTDDKHMNSEFGRIMLGNALTLLREQGVP